MQEDQDLLVLKAEGRMPISLFIQALGELQGMGEMQKGERRGKIPHASPSHFRDLPATTGSGDPSCDLRGVTALCSDPAPDWAHPNHPGALLLS